MQFLIRVVFFHLLAVVLSACGGGDEDTALCSSQAFSVSVQWNSNGSLARGVTGTKGMPLVATPVVTGLPESCKAQTSYSQVGTGELFPGLSLNTSTGVISGTPTQAVILSGPRVQMQVSGYNPITVLTNITVSD